MITVFKTKTKKLVNSTKKIHPVYLKYHIPFKTTYLAEDVYERHRQELGAVHI